MAELVLEETNEFEKKLTRWDRFLSDIFRAPGGFVLLTLMSLFFLPYIVSPEFADIILKTFGVPLLVDFGIELILNRDVDLKKHFLIYSVMAYLIYFVSNFSWNLVEIHKTFLIGFGTTSIILFIYFIFFRLLPKVENLIPGKQKWNTPRMRFIGAIIPSLLVSILVIRFLFQFFV
ncbi:MAG: hypothetical protein ACOCQD_01800 [archaeon]